MRLPHWRTVLPSAAMAVVLGCGVDEGPAMDPGLQPPELRALIEDPSGAEPVPLAPTPGASGLGAQPLPPASPPEASPPDGEDAGSGGSTARGASGSPGPTPTPSGSPGPTPTPSGSPSPTPTPSGSPSPTPTPRADALEEDDSSYTVLPPVPAAEPASVRGLVLLNGRPPDTPVRLSLVRTPGWEERPLSTEATGAFAATGLAPGDYLVHFYNETQRDRVGYWRSRTLAVTAARGAAFPAVDLGLRGMVNQPPMDARVSWPVTFRWEPPAHRPEFCRFRVHSQGGRNFSLLYQSGRLPAAPRAFTWDGTGANPPLEPGPRYFWGLVWDLGEAGEAGNLYQAIQLGSS
ncbi:MAG: hypothetical protein VKQ33_00645 [Candidatus Sericytochromatia bacterium]|nr:hypothetical protein [Candidatus Sericytochromatia bacterium]